MEELRRIRKERGLTQRELADASGVDPATISLIETGKRRPHLETLDSLGRALGVETGDLIPKVAPRLPFEESERRVGKREERTVGGQIASFAGTVEIDSVVLLKAFRRIQNGASPEEEFAKLQMAANE